MVLLTELASELSSIVDSSCVWGLLLLANNNTHHYLVSLFFSSHFQILLVATLKLVFYDFFLTVQFQLTQYGRLMVSGESSVLCAAHACGLSCEFGYVIHITG